MAPDKSDMRVVITERRGGHFEGESSGRGVGEERRGGQWERRGGQWVRRGEEGSGRGEGRGRGEEKSG